MTNTLLTTVEDLLDFLVDYMKVREEDKRLLDSLQRQTHHNKGLTDRQHALLKSKLLEYRDEFSEVALLHESFDMIDFDALLDSLRLPIRQIDRSKTVKLTTRQSIYFGGIEEEVCVAIRFPFSNRMIKHIQAIKDTPGRPTYDAKTKTHLLAATELNIYRIVERFRDLNFTIEPKLLEFAEAVREIANNPEDNIPGIHGYTLKHIHPKAEELALATLGEPDNYNYYLYKDRFDEYGLAHFDEYALAKSTARLTELTKSVLDRNLKHVYISSDKYGYDNIFKTVTELQRWPILIVLSGNAPMCKSSTQYPNPELSLLSLIHNMLLSYVTNKDISVMYRKEKTTKEDLEFNDYIRRHRLNNRLTKDLKVVILSEGKRIPKPIVESDWRPQCSLMLGAGFTPNKSIIRFADDSPLIFTYDRIFLYRARDHYHA